MAGDNQDKRFDPTEHRLREERKRGNVAKSQDLTSAAAFAGGVFVLIYFGQNMVAPLAELARGQLGADAWLALDADGAVALGRATAWRLAAAALPFLCAVMALGVLASWLQVGLLFTPERIAWNWQRINPLGNVKRLFDVASLVHLGLGGVKVALVGAVVLGPLWQERERLLTLGALETGQIARRLVELPLQTASQAALALLVIALVDYLWQRWKHFRDLRMTFQEMRDEMRNVEGDPQLRARRRAAMRKIAKENVGLLAEQADVVTVNPTEIAVGLKYDFATMAAPIVVCKGAGRLADRIRAVAREKNIPIVQRVELARFLFANVEVGQPIPVEQYAAVAELMRYVYALKGKPLPTAPPPRERA